MAVQEIEKLERSLKKEELELARDTEIERILSCFKLDHYTIFESKPGISSNDINKIYRNKSRLIHPDKSLNSRAKDAFDQLKKSSLSLLDDKERAKLDEIWADARMELMESNPNFNELNENDLKLWRAKVKDLIIELERAKIMEEKRKRFFELRKQRQEEEKFKEVESEQLMKKSWEEKRGDRVTKWRNFTNVSAAKKQKKLKKEKVLI